MTIEEFAHRCLMIKAGNATLDIPCCAHCKHYVPTVFSDGDTIWECDRPLEDEDDMGVVLSMLPMAPEDFCSRWRSRNEEKEVKKENKKA